MKSDEDAAQMHALRAPFPHLRSRVYLDTAAAGLCWQGHGEAVARFYESVKNRGYDAAPEWRAMTAGVRNRLAGWLGADPDGMSFVSNTTEGLNLVAHSLRWEAGDRIVLAADEFPSMAEIWTPALRAGARVDRIAIPDERSREALLIAGLDGGARLLAVSQVHWSTGTRLDLGRLASACRARGALLLVDGTQALGAVATDLRDVDLYAASCFKWLLSGFGVGVLATSARARAALSPAWRGYANLDDPASLQYAHVNIPALYGLDATLDFFDRIGWPLVFERVQTLGDHLTGAAQSRGLDLVTPAAARAGIFVLRCPDGEVLRAALSARGISVSARGSGIRISPHYYNTAAEIDCCLDAAAQWLAGR